MTRYDFSFVNNLYSYVPCPPCDRWPCGFRPINIVAPLGQVSARRKFDTSLCSAEEYTETEGRDSRRFPSRYPVGGAKFWAQKKRESES